MEESAIALKVFDIVPAGETRDLERSPLRGSSAERRSFIWLFEMTLRGEEEQRMQTPVDAATCKCSCQ